jgi:hypothetical protein
MVQGEDLEDAGSDTSEVDEGLDRIGGKGDQLFFSIFEGGSVMSG